jgi:NAD(P)-dependent dehydrogenase (short-subunit alcohol dehydrogenase family)
MDDARYDLSGKVVLLTGASGGIGRALIGAFLNAGTAEIIASSRKPIAAQASRVYPYTLDVTDTAKVNEAAKAFADRVDVIVNCSGANSNSRIFVPDSLDDARAEMEVNYFGLLNVVRAFAPAMQRRRQGVIVNMLSMVSFVNIPRMATYCASKAAAYSLTQAIRAELTPFGIHVCTMLPSATDTAMTAHLNVPKLKPQTVADAVIAAICDRIEDAHEGLIHDEIYQLLRTDPKSVERQMAAKLHHNN